MVTPEEKTKIWKEYEEMLLNKEYDRSRDFQMIQFKGLSEKVLIEEAMEALDHMNARKATGLCEDTSELLKVCKKKRVQKVWVRWQIICWQERRCKRIGEGVI